LTNMPKTIFDDETRRSTGEEFSPQRRFQNIESASQLLLNPGEEVDSRTISTLGYPGVLLVGNSRLNSEALTLRDVDFQAIGPLRFPGKSVMFDFLDIPGHGFKVGRDGREIVIQRSFGKGADRHDAIYFTDLDSILGAGFKLFYAPVKTNGLHLRIVYEPFTRLSYPALKVPEIPKDNLHNLQQIWKKVTLD
jgi:hypothetical protein